MPSEGKSLTIANRAQQDQRERLTASRGKADGVVAHVPQPLAGLCQPFGHISGAHVRRHLLPDLHGEAHRIHLRPRGRGACLIPRPLKDFCIRRLGGLFFCKYRMPDVVEGGHSREDTHFEWFIWQMSWPRKSFAPHFPQSKLMRSRCQACTYQYRRPYPLINHQGLVRKILAGSHPSSLRREEGDEDVLERTSGRLRRLKYCLEGR